MHQSHRVTVVLIEDNPGQALLIEKSLRRAGIVNPIITLVDSGAAVAHLFGQGEEAGTRLNSSLLILLDLSVPDSCQVLERLKSDERTRRIPVVILAPAGKQQEITRCYALGCNVCVNKPVEESRLSDAIWKLGMFFSILKVPEAVENNG